MQTDDFLTAAEILGVSVTDPVIQTDSDAPGTFVEGIATPQCHFPAGSPVIIVLYKNHCTLGNLADGAFIMFDLRNMREVARAEKIKRNAKRKKR